MFETQTQRINKGVELAAYSWPGYRELLTSGKAKEVHVPVMSCWCTSDAYYEYVSHISEKDDGTYILPPVPGEVFKKPYHLNNFKGIIEKKYPNVSMVLLDGKDIESGKPDAILGTFGVVEEHGYHLPLDSDNIRIYGLSKRIIEKFGESGNIITVPSLSYGVTGQYEWCFPGTLNTGPEILHKMARNYINEINSAFPDARILFLTAHAHPDHLGVEPVVDEFDPERILFRFDFDLIDKELTKTSELEIRGHSAKGETSVIMCYNPEWVDPDQDNIVGGRVDREKWDKIPYSLNCNPDDFTLEEQSGANGWDDNKPIHSSTEYGERFISEMLKGIEELI